ncbi:flavin-binding monooxygenase-like protein [Paraphoma chrysanthemicola]|nr:flavin-binding monooxygenase-like protein [Paraphoma chrysanthemicola]
MEPQDPYNLFTRRRPGQPFIPDVTLNDPASRKIKVITIGAGLCGIMNAYNIQKECSNVEHVVYDKNPDLGGVWYENTYPGVACDVPSHAYSFHFAPNADWPKFLSPGKDIWNYFDQVATVFKLRKYMKFNTEVISATWNEKKSRWYVKIKDHTILGEDAESEDWCDVLLYATGLLNNWKWPHVEGRELFKGRVIHSANWPKDFQAEQWKDQRIAVVGSGASSIQVVPALQPYVMHLDVFVRSAVWFVQLVEGYPQDYAYTPAERKKFREHPEQLVKHVKYFEDQLNGKWDVMFKGSQFQEFAQKKFKARMRKFIKDDRLFEGFTPKWSYGCRRVTPGDPYISAIQKPNVDVHFTPLATITRDGVIGGDGIFREVDTIICATGFDVSFKPRFPIVGRNGVSLNDKWDKAPLSYFGVTVPDMPNFMVHGGPPSPLQNGTPLGFFHALGDYAIQMIKKIQFEDLKSVEPKKDVTRNFGEHCQAWVKESVFSDDCNSFYKDAGPELSSMYAGSVLHYREMLKNVRWEDYHIQYRDPSHMWAFMGNGFTLPQKLPDMDLSPYIEEKKIDPEWITALQSGKGIRKPVLKIGGPRPRDMVNGVNGVH